MIRPLADRLKLHLDEDMVKREDLLEIFILGAVMADRELRDSLDADDFIHVDMQCAMSELKNGGSYKYLRGCMSNMLGVSWDVADGPPLGAAVARFKQNGKRAGVLDMLVAAMRALEGSRTDEDIDKFFEACVEAGSRAGASRQADAAGLSRGVSR